MGRKRKGEIILLKRENNFQVPEMYVQHPCAPLEAVSAFNLSLIQTFALKEGEETEWYSDKHFSCSWHEDSLNVIIEGMKSFEGK